MKERFFIICKGEGEDRVALESFDQKGNEIVTKDLLHKARRYSREEQAKIIVGWMNEAYEDVNYKWYAQDIYV